MQDHLKNLKSSMLGHPHPLGLGTGSPRVAREHRCTLARVELGFTPLGFVVLRWFAKKNYFFLHFTVSQRYNFKEFFLKFFFLLFTLLYIHTLKHNTYTSLSQQYQHFSNTIHTHLSLNNIKHNESKESYQHTGPTREIESRELATTAPAIVTGEYIQPNVSGY